MSLRRNRDSAALVASCFHRIFSYSVYAVTIVLLAWLGRQWSDLRQEPVRPVRQACCLQVRRRILANAVSVFVLLTMTAFILRSGIIPAAIAAAPTPIADDRETDPFPVVHAP